MMQTETPVPEESVVDAVGAPVTLVPDADPEVLRKRASEIARLIDLHLDYERQSRIPFSTEDLTPRQLCPEQRVNLISDLYAAIR